MDVVPVLAVAELYLVVDASEGESAEERDSRSFLEVAEGYEPMVNHARK